MAKSSANISGNGGNVSDGSSAGKKAAASESNMEVSPKVAAEKNASEKTVADKPADKKDQNSAPKIEFKAHDRVRRRFSPSAANAAGANGSAGSGPTGCLGEVKEIRTEVTNTNPDARAKNLMVRVFWDNGTISYLSPESLELVTPA